MFYTELIVETRKKIPEGFNEKLSGFFRQNQDLTDVVQSTIWEGNEDLFRTNGSYGYKNNKFAAIFVEEDNRRFRVLLQLHPSRVSFSIESLKNEAESFFKRIEKFLNDNGKNSMRKVEIIIGAPDYPGLINGKFEDINSYLSEYIASDWITKAYIPLATLGGIIFVEYFYHDFSFEKVPESAIMSPVFALVGIIIWLIINIFRFRKGFKYSL